MGQKEAIYPIKFHYVSHELYLFGVSLELYLWNLFNCRTPCHWTVMGSYFVTDPHYHHQRFFQNSSLIRRVDLEYVCSHYPAVSCVGTARRVITIERHATRGIAMCCALISELSLSLRYPTITNICAIVCCPNTTNFRNNKWPQSRDPTSRGPGSA